MLILQKLLPNQGVEALHQQLYQSKVKTRNLAACQEDKAAFIQGHSRLKAQIALRASSYGAAGAADTNPISLVSCFLLGEGNSLMGTEVDHPIYDSKPRA